MKRATHKADDLLAANRITSWILRQSLTNREPARMIAKQYEDRTKSVSNWNPAISTKQKGYRKQGRPPKRLEDDLNTYLHPDRTNRDNNELTSDMTWLSTAVDTSLCDATESDCKQQDQTTSTHLLLNPRGQHDPADMNTIHHAS